MDWFAPVDLYCERLGPAIDAEPLNAVSNLSFFAAALYGIVLQRRGGGRDVGVLVLAVIAALVGAGSFLFHTLATRAAMLADVVPIALFIAVGFGLVLSRLAGARPAVAVGATLAFLVASPFVQRLFAPLLGSSAGYAPALAALVIMGGWLVGRGVRAARFLLLAGAVFAVSIGLRMADLPVCASWPVGTHFGWHLLNGVVLALVMRAIARR